MALEFEFIGPNDKPALLAISTPELHTHAMAALKQLDYKVHSAATHADFITRFGQVQYQVTIIEDTFGGGTPAENEALRRFQWMPMAARRHTTAFLISHTAKSLHAMEAYQQSVHAVVNPTEFSNLPQIIQKVVAENDIFLSIFRDAQRNRAQGKI
jgi:hypothetical protein